MEEFSLGDRVKVEFEGVVTADTIGHSRVVIKEDESSYQDVISVRHVKRIGKTVRPNQVWERDGERFYVRGGQDWWAATAGGGYIPTPGVDLISFTTNRRAFHLPFGSSNSLEDEGFELVLDVEEDKS